MNQLEEMKARAEVNQHLGKTASQDEAKATLKLIAALEAVLEACTKVDRESSEAEQDWLAWAIENAIKEALQ